MATERELKQMVDCADFLRGLNNLDLGVWSKEQLINTALGKLGIPEHKWFKVVPSPRDDMSDAILEILDELYTGWRNRGEYDRCISKVAADIKHINSLERDIETEISDAVFNSDKSGFLSWLHEKDHIDTEYGDGIGSAEGKYCPGDDGFDEMALAQFNEIDSGERITLMIDYAI